MRLTVQSVHLGEIKVIGHEAFEDQEARSARLEESWCRIRLL